MFKDFDAWNTQKKKIHSKEFPGFIHERDIWWCSLGMNVGDEQDGKNDRFERPVLIFKKFSRNMFLGLPLTSGKKQGKYYLPIPEGVSNRDSMIILSQIRLLSTKRVIRKMGRVDRAYFFTVQRSIVAMLLSK